MRARAFESRFFNYDVARMGQTRNARTRVEAAEFSFVMNVSLKHVITVVPLRKPREKLWAKKICDRSRERVNQITEVLEKLEEVDDRQSGSLQWRGKDKDENDNRPTISSLKGFARESPGM